MVHPRTPERRPRDSSVSSWPTRQHHMPSPSASPSSTASPGVSPGVSPAGAARRSPRKPARPTRTPQFAVEEDPVILARRQKQIEYGKNTLAYQQYTAAVPHAQRLGYHPRTPVKRRVQSRRRWDNAIKCWRVHLHYWNDPAKLAELRGQESASDTSSVVSDPPEKDVAKTATGAPGEKAAAPAEKSAAPAEMGTAATEETASADELGAATGRKQRKAEGTEAASMEESACGATGMEEAEDFDWADDVEGLAMEIAE